jgi:hypothetical protein
MATAAVRSWRIVLAALLLGWAAGTPAAAQDIPFSHEVIAAVPPNGPDTKTVGDIDGDGFPDVIVASSTFEGMYWYRYPDWTRFTIRPTGGWTTDMQAGDVDGDGDLDIIAPYYGGGLHWYRNPRPGGDPTSGPWEEILIGGVGGSYHDVEVGDLNGDGKLDVVTRAHGGHDTHVWIQQTPTTWAPGTAASESGEGIALGDIDGDGDLDIAQNGLWLENPRPSGNILAAWPQHPIAPEWYGVYVGVLIADVNGDGRQDVVLAPSESEDGKFAWYEAAKPKTGPWIEHVIDPSVSYFHTFKAADMDGDGDLDLVTAEMHQSADPDEVSVYRNQGGGLAWTQQVIGTAGSHNLRIADIDADGDVDVVGVNWHESAADGAAVNLWRNLRVSTLFADVPGGHWARSWIEALHAAGVTAGCATGPLRYCPESPVTRGQMAVFLLRASEGAGYQPPACTTPPFADVPCGQPFAAWIAELARRNISHGCGAGLYCPESAVTREQMAVFLLRARDGSGYTPPPCGPAAFLDVPCSSPFAPWIEELVRRAVTAGCGAGRYCPAQAVSRAEMAVFLMKTFPPVP